MPSVEKIIDKMKAFGYELVRQRGSHKQYLKRETGELTTIKQENPLKKVYIMDILNRISQGERS